MISVKAKDRPFEHAFSFAMRWEVGNLDFGGYTNDPDDPGGETKWGISKRGHPFVDIVNLTRAMAEELTLSMYWKHSGAQKSYCDSMPWPLNWVHFDCTFNVGNYKTTRDKKPLFHGRANMILQRALGVDDDGLIGPITIAAIELGEKSAIEVAVDAMFQRNRYYLSRGPWADKFRHGWFNRVRDLCNEVTLACDTRLDLRRCLADKLQLSTRS